ncbi:MAG: hypothetical protein Q8M59_15685 [Tabrizicola sp.]|nr:hypothetical protein [Tabrizicola sp.]
MDADVGDLRDLLHLGPEALGITDRLVGHIPGEEERATSRHDFAAQADQGHRFVRDRHSVDAALLGVGGLLWYRHGSVAQNPFGIHLVNPVW